MLAIFGAICWGIAPAFGKVGLKGIHPLDGLAARTVITVLLVGSWFFFSGGFARLNTIATRNWTFLAAEAFLATFAGDLAYFAAIKQGDIGPIALVLATSPLITLGVGYFFLGEPLSLVKAAGALLIVIGIVLIGANSW